MMMILVVMVTMTMIFANSDIIVHISLCIVHVLSVFKYATSFKLHRNPVKYNYSLMFMRDEKLRDGESK